MSYNLKLVGPDNAKLKAKPLPINQMKIASINRGRKIGRAMVLFIKQHSCWGLAANQFGLMDRICAARIDGEYRYFINPMITKRQGTQRSAERSLTWPDAVGVTNRPKKITISYYSDAGIMSGLHSEETFKGFNATILDHIIDQLDGIRWIDKMENKMEKPKGD